MLDRVQKIRLNVFITKFQVRNQWGKGGVKTPPLPGFN